MEARAGLGGALAGKGRVAEAIPHLQRAAQLSPENPGVLVNLCLALSLAGRAQEAIPEAQKAVALTNGQDPLLLDMLGRLYAQSGRLAEAIEHDPPGHRPRDPGRQRAARPRPEVAAFHIPGERGGRRGRTDADRLAVAGSRVPAGRGPATKA